MPKQSSYYHPDRKQKMDWWALRKNKCPKCGSELEPADGHILIYCSSNRCDFSITEQRMKEIVQSQNAKDVEQKFND